MRSCLTSFMARRLRRPDAALTLALLAFAAAAVLSVCVGAVEMSLADLWRALTGRDEVLGRILWYARLPRAAAAILAGSALAVSGAVIQSVLNNPMAGPNIIGINSGAGFAAALCSALAPAVPGLVTGASFAGALLSTLLIYAIARRTGASRITLVLAGIAVNYFMNAGTDAVVTLVPDALVSSTQFRMGSLRGVTFRQLAPAALLILAAILGTLLLSHEMDVLRLGEELAGSLGLQVGLVRFALLLLASALAGAAVSFAGLLGFVGLIVPHVARIWVGEESRWLLPLSALLGGAFLSVCDVLARVLFAPFELPVGIIMAALGAPFFIWLLLRQRGGRGS